jgi:hypothetical protein
LCEEVVSGRSLDLIDRWIRICRRDHKYCSDSSGVELPTRVVDGEIWRPLKIPSLLITQGESGRYAALSHCWGISTPKSPHFKTETQSIEERRAGIPLEM